MRAAAASAETADQSAGASQACAQQCSGRGTSLGGRTAPPCDSAPPLPPPAKGREITAGSLMGSGCCGLMGVCGSPSLSMGQGDAVRDSALAAEGGVYRRTPPHSLCVIFRHLPLSHEGSRRIGPPTTLHRKCRAGGGGGAQRGRRWTACGQRRVDSKHSQTTPATTSTPSIHQLLGAADTQTAHHATFSTTPTHQLLGSANTETTPARAPAAAADRKQQPDATCEGKNG